jgi:hypothetical protein
MEAELGSLAYTVQLDANQKLSYLAKCDSSHCARRHPPRGPFIRGRNCGDPSATAGTMSTSNDFRDKAEECRQPAEKATTARNKEVWLRIAETWMKLAQETDQCAPKRKQ